MKPRKLNGKVVQCLPNQTERRLLCNHIKLTTSPAFAADYFGPKNVGPIYGLMLTAWGFASVFGPLLIAHMRETAGSYRGALHVIAGVMAISTLLPILVRPPRTRDTRTTKIVSHPSARAVAGVRP